MASIISPPLSRPPRPAQTRYGGKFYYTIHSHPNQAFAVRASENASTALVCFKSEQHAMFIGQMIEAHYMKQKELPDPSGQLLLPLPSEDELLFLFLQKWDFEDLKLECTKNFLNMVSINDVEDTKRGFNLSGEVLAFEAPVEFYVERLNELLDV
jgi:hypothetical protein